MTFNPIYSKPPQHNVNRNPLADAYFENRAQQQQAPSQAPGLMEQLTQGFGGGLGEGIAGGIKQGMQRSVLEKTLGMMNPNMSPLEKYKIVAMADPETQQALMPYLELEREQEAAQQKRLDEQRHASALSQALSGRRSQTPGTEMRSGMSQRQREPVDTAALTSTEALKIAELNQKEDQYLNNLEEKRRENRITSEEKISIPILEANEGERTATRLQESALQNAELALQNRDLSFFSPDSLSDLFHTSAFRTPEGALFKTAIKENLIGGMSRIGASAAKNQWIEKQIYDMGPQIGTSNAANQTIVEALKSDINVRKKLVETRDQLSDRFREENGYVPANINRIADEMVKPYAEQEQKKLAYRLQEIKESEEDPIQSGKIKRVRKGTPLTEKKAAIILKRVGGDKKIAMKISKDAGYDITDASTVSGER